MRILTTTLLCFSAGCGTPRAVPPPAPATAAPSASLLEPPQPPPKPPPPLVTSSSNGVATIDGDSIRLSRPITFHPDKDTFKQPDSQPALDALVDILQKNPTLRVEIQGHSDPQHYAYGRRPTQSRAESVRRYLIDHGIAQERLTAKGYGETKPIADNKTPEGRRMNRRIEVLILRRDARPPGP
jgi:outer membrane protein OmpA-like peptidoglycan-associated protein